MVDLESTTILLEPLRPAPDGRILRMQLPRFMDTISAFRRSKMVTTGTSSMDYEESIRDEHIYERKQQTEPIPDPIPVPPPVIATQHPRVPSGIVLPLQRTATLVPYGAVASTNNVDSARERLDGDQQSRSNTEAVLRVLSEHLGRLEVCWISCLTALTVGSMDRSLLTFS